MIHTYNPSSPSPISNEAGISHGLKCILQPSLAPSLRAHAVGRCCRKAFAPPFVIQYTTVDEGACKVWSSNALRCIRHFTSMWKSVKDLILNIAYSKRRLSWFIGSPNFVPVCQGDLHLHNTTPQKRAWPLPSMRKWQNKKPLGALGESQPSKKRAMSETGTARRRWQRVSPSFFLTSVSLSEHFL